VRREARARAKVDEQLLELWDFVRAMHSRKIYYFLKKLKPNIEANNGIKFVQAFPDLGPASGGKLPLGKDNQDRLRDQFSMRVLDRMTLCY